jgi:hypothetical protein
VNIFETLKKKFLCIFCFAELEAGLLWGDEGPSFPAHLCRLVLLFPFFLFFFGLFRFAADDRTFSHNSYSYFEEG